MSITEPILNAKLGDVSHALGFQSIPFPKKVGTLGQATHRLLKGRLCAKDTDDTTQNLFTNYKTGAVKPFIVPRGNITISPPLESTEHILTDANGNLRDANGFYISALETDSVVSAVYTGYIVVEFAETVQFGDPVMGQNNTGKLINWDGDDEMERVGFYQSRPGYRTGEFPPVQVLAGQLGWLKFDI